MTRQNRENSRWDISESDLGDPDVTEWELERRKLDALAEFAAGAGHEINNPLAIINGHAQMLLGQIDVPDQRRSLAVIQAQVKRAYEMIADIRLFARPPQPEFRTFDAIALVEEALERLTNELPGRYGIDPRVIRVHWNRPESSNGNPTRIVSDPTQISVALLAVLRNAVEAVGTDATWERPGEIAITLEPTDGTEHSPDAKSPRRGITITVCDNGPGIAEHNRPMIFSPYFSGRQAGRGLGFGLSKAWRILRQCHGLIRCTSYEPGHTSFVIHVPDLPDDSPDNFCS